MRFTAAFLVILGLVLRINTYSLFSVMDYCLTVRGTIGIECASHGIRVLTAGSGRYDHRGFTIDSSTAAEYLERLATIQGLPPLNARELALAERYAHAAFLLRPWPLSSIVIEHDRDIEATMRVRVAATTSNALREAADLRAFGEWAADGKQEDFLWSPIGGAAIERIA